MGVTGGLDTCAADYGQGDPGDEGNHRVDGDREDLELGEGHVGVGDGVTELRRGCPDELMDAEADHRRDHGDDRNGGCPLPPFVGEHSHNVALHVLTPRVQT